VADATAATWFGGIYQEPKNFFPQFPVDPEEYLAMYPEFLIPDEQKQEWFRTRTGAIVGRSTADRFGFEIGDKVPIQATIWPKEGNQLTWEFDIVGIYDGAEQGTDTTQLLFHYDYFDEARQFLRGQVGWYVVRIENPEDSARIASEIDATFANSPAETKAETEGAFLTGFAEQIGNIGAVITAIISAVFFTILLVAGNTMAQSVRERTGELAVLKAVGFTDGQVLGLVLAESVSIALLGGLAGLGIAAAAISAGDPTGGWLPLFFFPRADVVIGVALVLALGLVTGLLPALQAGRLRIADALRRL
jgi:putative ABC transport system permease protein